MPKYYVYILRSSGNCHYIGFTSNLARRISQHNKKHKGFTGRREETWKLVVSHEMPDKVSGGLGRLVNGPGNVANRLGKCSGELRRVSGETRRLSAANGVQ